jgi:hypothetical protein
MLRVALLLCILLAACAPSAASGNPSQSQVLTEVAAAMGETTQTIPPPYFSFEEETYADRVSHSTGNVVTALDAFREHIARLDADPALLQDEAWLAELQLMLDELDHTSERVSNIAPIPDIFVDLNPKMLALGAAITKLVDDYSALAFDGDEELADATPANIDAITLLLHEIAVQLRDITFDAFSS